jgi:hypothetical protein
VILETHPVQYHAPVYRKVAEISSRYFFIVLYLWLEKYFIRGDDLANKG